MKLYIRPLALILAILMLVGLCGCDDGKDSLDRILKKQTIVFGISPDSIPMSYVTMNDKTEGLSVDIGNELAKRLAVSAEFVFVEQEDALEALANEEIDCYLNLVSSDI